MEEDKKPKHRSQNISMMFPSQKQKNSFFQSYFKAEVKRFSQNIVHGTVPHHQQKVFLRFFSLFLQSQVSNRTDEDCEAIARVLQEQQIFQEFKNDCKVLKMLAKYLNAKRLDSGEFIFTPQTRDLNLYKIVQGTVMLTDDQRDSQTQEILKGYFVQQLSKFNEIKKVSAVCRQQCYFLVIKKDDYEEVLNFYLNSKVILKMLHQTAMLASLNKKQILYLFKSSKQMNEPYKRQIFQENKEHNSCFYFIIQGEVALQKTYKDNQRPSVVCKISDGLIFGEQNLILESTKRSYTATVSSLKARILEVSHQSLQECLKITGKTIDSFVTSTQYQHLVKLKLKHYRKHLIDSDKIKASLHVTSGNPRLGERINRLQSITKIGEQIQKRVECLTKIVSKRSNYQTAENKIDFHLPLFRREDFPQLQTSLKRFANEQKYALQKFKLPKIR